MTSQKGQARTPVYLGACDTCSRDLNKYVGYATAPGHKSCYRPECFKAFLESAQGLIAKFTNRTPPEAT